MSNTACATLILRTSDISATPSTIGVSNANKSQLNWININLRTLLGDLYDKYDTFNLRLTGVNGNALTYGTAAIDRLHVVNISGLPWINCTYNTSTKMNTDTCQIASFAGGNNTSFNVNFESSAIATFTKCQNTDITITLLKMDGTTPSMSANTLIPRMQFFFIITGVK